MTTLQKYKENYNNRNNKRNIKKIKNNNEGWRKEQQKTINNEILQNDIMGWMDGWLVGE